MKNLESPTAGERRNNTQVVDSVKESNSGMMDGGFYRPVQRFNSNDVMKSPTTSSGECKQSPQKIKINKGIAGKIGY
jgi:hypothetical protein